MLAGEKRSMGTGSFVMVHRAMADTFGNAQELRKAAEDLEKIEDGIKAIYTERTGADDETLAEWLDGEDHWLNADDAAQAGFVTETFEQLKAVASFDIQAKFKSAPPPVVAALQQQTQQKDNEMKILMKTLGLSEDANEAAVIEAVNKLKGDAQAAQDLASEQEALVGELTKAINDIKAKAEADAKAAAEAAATELVEASGFTGEAKDALMEVALINIKAAKALVDNAPRASAAPTVPAEDSAPKLSGMDAVRAAFKAQLKL